MFYESEGHLCQEIAVVKGTFVIKDYFPRETQHFNTVFGFLLSRIVLYCDGIQAWRMGGSALLCDLTNKDLFQ